MTPTPRPRPTHLKLLSIDFDGLLHPVGTGITQINTTFFGFLPVLEAFLAPHAEVRVLVHSTWRYSYQAAALQMFLGGLGERFVGAAPRGPRYESVLWFIQQNPQFASYRILDDDPREFPDPPPAEVIFCDPLLGITDPQLQAQLRAWLTNP